MEGRARLEGALGRRRRHLNWLIRKGAGLVGQALRGGESAVKKELQTFTDVKIAEFLFYRYNPPLLEKSRFLMEAPRSRRGSKKQIGVFQYCLPRTFWLIISSLVSGCIGLSAEVRFRR